jgi:hypothetical protein
MDVDVIMMYIVDDRRWKRERTQYCVLFVRVPEVPRVGKEVSLW